MLRIFLWASLISISVVVGSWRDLLALQRVPGGLLGQILCAFGGGWCLQVMFSSLRPPWWVGPTWGFALLLQCLGAWGATFLLGRIRWEPYEGEGGRR